MSSSLIVDLGTTTIKTYLIDFSGEIRSKHTATYESIVTQKGLHEQNPKIWITAIKEGIKSVIEQAENIDKKDIEALTFVTQRSTLVPVDESGEPLYNALTWMDNRKPSIGEDKKKLYNHRLPIEKILWFKQELPDIFEKTEKFLLADSFLALKFAGETVSSKTQGVYLLYDATRNKYDEEKLEELGIDVEKLPEVKPSDYIVGTIKPELARELEIRAETQIVIGSGDQQASALGLGMLEPNDTKLTLGTGAFLDVVAKGYLFDYYDENTRMFNLPHAIENEWLLEAVVPGAGTLLDWFVNNFAKEESKKAKALKISPYSILDDQASEVDPTSEGLLVIPLFAFGRGVLKGLSFAHDKKHLYRGMLEGIGYSVRFFIDLIESLEYNVEIIRLDGGGANSKIWPQIIADITGKMVAITKAKADASAIGGLILAGKALGVFSSYEKATDEIVKVWKLIEPNEANNSKYQEIYDQFIDELLNAAQDLEV